MNNEDKTVRRVNTGFYGPANPPVPFRLKKIEENKEEDKKEEDDGDYEPLLGYVILEQAQVAVDMLGHRLVPVKYIDCK
jgi:hypothetical protein